MSTALSDDEKLLLLQIARQTLEAAVCGTSLVALDRHSLPPALLEMGATFVTLTNHGLLRGCIGALEAVAPLVDDVREHTVAAALNDFRFSPVQPEELEDVRIEISWLTPPTPLGYEGPDDLVRKLRPGVDGVVLFDNWRRATFLPQVWEKIPDAEEFLAHLCSKMGAAPQAWRAQKMKVMTYQVEEFSETEPESRR